MLISNRAKDTAMALENQRHCIARLEDDINKINDDRTNDLKRLLGEMIINSQVILSDKRTQMMRSLLEFDDKSDDF